MAEVLRAELAAVRLASILQLAEGEMFRGALRLPGGELRFRDGELVWARCGRLTGVDALRELFLVGAGTAVLESGEVTGERLGQTLALVMEGCRVADEWDRLAGMVVSPAGPVPADALPASVVRRMNGRLSLGEVVKALDLPVVSILDPVLRLLEEGTLQSRAAPTVAAGPASSEPPPPAAPAPTYWAALEAGRAHLRSGELDRAEGAFRQALAEHPGDRIATQNLRRVHVLRGAESNP